MKWIKASERLPQEYTDLHIKWTDPSSTDNVVKGTGHFDGMDSFNVIGTSEQLPIEEIEWLDETQSVTNEEIERMMDEFFKTYTDSTGWHNPPGWYAKDTWQYVKTSILPLLQSKTEQTNPNAQRM